MPLISQDDLLNIMDPRDGNLNPESSRAYTPTPEHSLGETMGAAFRTENVVGSIWNSYDEDKAATNPDYDPIARLDKIGRPDLYDAVAFADSDEEVDAVELRVDKEQEDRQIIDESGWTGVASMLVAGTVDPFILIPGTMQIKMGMKAMQIGRGLASGAAYGAGAAMGQEAVLEATQLTRDPNGLLVSGIAGAVLGGILGGSVGALTRSARRGQDIAVANLMTDANPMINIDIPTGSAGAARTDIKLSIAQAGEQLKNDEGINALNDTLTKVVSSPIRALRSPVVNGLTSVYGNMRKATNMFFEHNFILNKNLEGEKTMASVEGLGKIDEAAAILLNDKISKLYIKSVGLEGKVGAEFRAAVGGMTEGRMSYQKFSEEVAYAMRRGDAHDIPEVAEASKLLRTDMDAAVVKMQKAGILPEDLEVTTARSYLTRRYNVKAINAPGGRARLASILTKHFAHNLGEHTTSPNVMEKVDKTIRNITGVGDQAMELDNVATNVIVTGGKFNKKRVLDIADSELEGFLVNDGISLGQGYLHQANAILRFQEVLEREGFENMSQMRKAVTDESEALGEIANRKLAALKGITAPTKENLKDIKSLTKEINNLTKELGIAIKELNNSARVVLGQFGKGTNSIGDNALKTVRKFQTLRLLGGMALAAIPDAAMTFFKHGPMAVMRDGILPMLKNFKASKLSKDELSDFNVGLELMQNEILRAMTDGDFTVLAGKSRLNSIGDHAVQNFGKITLNSYWTKAGKRLGGQLSVSRTFRALKTVDAGGKISAKESTRLASLGIGPEDYAKIWSQFGKHGEEVDGSFIANFGAWDTETREMFGAAVTKDVDSTILTPGRGDIPFFASQNELSKTVFQFKSFTSAATNKILLSGLQRKDANALSGMAMLVALGGMSWMLKGAVGGRDVAGDAMDDDELFTTFVSEGLSRSGVLGLMGDALFALNPYSTNSRYRGLNTSSYLGGPSWNLVQDMYKAASPLLPSEGGHKGLTSADYKKMSRMLPYQNLFWTRAIWQQVNNK
jgi:hypothetical protein